MVNNESLDALFFALADPTRRRMVERLSRRSLSVGELAAGFPMSQPAISKHVKILEKSGLLVREISGRTHTCRLDPDAIRRAGSWLDRQERYWNGALDKLKAYLENEP